ncbi:kinase-like protein [Pluteus cervinus]|uniref:Kinase-like protein n=1 Tax=Pluteus cervinus TaxID=181527 RepID=A0ACD3A3T8_9AGAR|nr:kinase-like protein [Pluteus cervinus]
MSLTATTKTANHSTWQQRKTRLATLLKSQGDEDADALALDRLMHGHQVIGKTARTSEIDALRFQDKDLDLVGTLEYGQFGLIDVVTCRMNGISYIRKSIQKVFAMRTREQCSPQYERDLLLLARKSNTKWAPQLLCAFQTPTHLSLIMDYAEGGTLWDVLESSPDERIKAQNMRWWTPQIVSAVHWCHTQGFVHRYAAPRSTIPR